MKKVNIVYLIFMIVFVLAATAIYSQGSWGSYSTKYEYDSIRNQEKIIELLRKIENNTECECKR